MEANLWQTWIESKSGEDGDALGWAPDKDLDISLEGKKLKQQDSFVYLGGAACRDGSTEMEIHRRIQAGANAWRKVEGVMGDIHISLKLIGKVISPCVTSNKQLEKNVCGAPLFLSKQ